MSLMSPQVAGAEQVGKNEANLTFTLLQTTSIETHGYEILIFLTNKMNVENYTN